MNIFLSCMAVTTLRVHRHQCTVYSSATSVDGLNTLEMTKTMMTAVDSVWKIWRQLTDLLWVVYRFFAVALPPSLGRCCDCPRDTYTDAVKVFAWHDRSCHWNHCSTSLCSCCCWRWCAIMTISVPCSTRSITVHTQTLICQCGCALFLPRL